MSTVDPAVERARRDKPQKDRQASLPRLLVAAAGCLVTGYLFGRGLAGIVAALLWSASQASSELSTSQMPPYWWGLGAGTVGVGMLLWYRSESRRFTGVLSRPVVGVSLAVAAAACGVWLQGLRWTGPEYYWSEGFRYEASQHQYWLVEHSDWWLPVVCVIVAGLIPASVLWFSWRRRAKARWVRHVRETGLRTRGVVTEATRGDREIDGHRFSLVTVKFTDHAGVERWVMDRAGFDPAAMPSVGMQATVLYDPARLSADKIVVDLDPREAVNRQLRDDAAEPSPPQTGQDDGSSPPWGSPSGGFLHNDKQRRHGN